MAKCAAVPWYEPFKYNSLILKGVDFLCSVALHNSILDGDAMKNMLSGTSLSSSMTKIDQINAMLELRLLSNLLAQDMSAQNFEANLDLVCF